MNNDLHLPDDCWMSPTATLAVGDLLAAVPFIAIDHPRDAEFDEEFRVFRVPVVMGHAIVLKIAEDQAVVVKSQLVV